MRRSVFASGCPKGLFALPFIVCENVMLVRQEIAQTLASDEQVDDEIHRLFQAVSEP